MHRKNLILIILFVLILPSVSYVASFKAVAFDGGFYNQEFTKYNPNISDREGITSDLIKFLEYSPNDFELVKSFQEKEISHLIDVKKLMHRFIFLSNIFILLLAAILILLYYSDKKRFFYNFGLSFCIGGAFSLIISSLSYILLNNFDWAFTSFHQLFFAGNWQFPADSLLITLFPEQFWIDASYHLMFNALIIANILIVVGISFLLINKYKK
jgi:integral membrane protein (TIGR01906 family)